MNVRRVSQHDVADAIAHWETEEAAARAAECCSRVDDADPAALQDDAGCTAPGEFEALCSSCWFVVDVER